MPQILRHSAWNQANYETQTTPYSEVCKLERKADLWGGSEICKWSCRDRNRTISAIHSQGTHLWLSIGHTWLDLCDDVDDDEKVYGYVTTDRARAYVLHIDAEELSEA